MLHLLVFFRIVQGRVGFHLLPLADKLIPLGFHVPQVRLGIAHQDKVFLPFQLGFCLGGVDFAQRVLIGLGLCVLLPGLGLAAQGGSAPLDAVRGQVDGPGQLRHGLGQQGEGSAIILGGWPASSIVFPNSSISLATPTTCCSCSTSDLLLLATVATPFSLQSACLVPQSISARLLWDFCDHSLLS